MILTETLFRKIISFAVPRETQFHTDLMAQASAVLRGAHKRGVELEYILEVRPCPSARSAARQTGQAPRAHSCDLSPASRAVCAPGFHLAKGCAFL